MQYEKTQGSAKHPYKSNQQTLASPASAISNSVLLSLLQQQEELNTAASPRRGEIRWGTEQERYLECGIAQCNRIFHGNFPDVIQRGKIKKKIKIKKGSKSHIEKIKSGKRIVPKPKRNTTTFHYVTKRNRQGPHIIPVIVRAVITDALEGTGTHPKVFAGTRLILTPEAAEKNIEILLKDNGVKDSEVKEKTRRYILNYRRKYNSLMKEPSIERACDIFAKLTDLSPFQTTCVNEMPTKEQLQYKGETQKRAASSLLGNSQDICDTLGASTRLIDKTSKIYKQIQTVAQTEDNESLELSEDSEES